MALNPSIILAGQGFDAIGTLDRSRQAAEGQIGLNTQNALAALYRDQGAGIAAGDQGALNALAQFDPAAALGIQDARLGLDAKRQDMDFTAKKMAALDTATQREAEAYAKSISAEQAAQEAAALEAGIKQALAAPTPEAFDALMVQSGRPEMVGQFDNREVLAAQFMSVAEILKMNAGPEWVAATPDQAAQYGATAGQINNQTGQFQKTGDGNGVTQTVTNPDGTTTTIQVGGAARSATAAPGDGGTRNGQVFDAISASADSARAAITGLRALREAEAALEGGAITGFAAEQRLSAAKLGALMGVTDPAIVQNTETFRSAIAPQVAAMLKATVGSAQISNSDREFAEKAAGGSIALDEGTIRRLLGIMEKAAVASVESHKRRLDAVYPEGSGADRERALFGVTLPGENDAPATGARRLKFNPETGELE